MFACVCVDMGSCYLQTRNIVKLKKIKSSLNIDCSIILICPVWAVTKLLYSNIYMIMNGILCILFHTVYFSTEISLQSRNLI
jgi:hypothetical protein